MQDGESESEPPTLADVDRRLKRLERKVDRINGHLGIIDVDDAGIPNHGERTEPGQRAN